MQYISERILEELPKLNRLLRHWVLVAGGYVVLNLVAFGLLCLAFAEELASGSPLACGICAFISVFWGIRLVIQIFLFDAREYLRTRFLKVGYHSLTCVFAWHTLVHGFAATWPWFQTP